MLKPLAILVLLLMQTAHPAFLVGQEGGKLAILCEGQQAVFVSTPQGEVRKLALDADFQAVFEPDAAGIYTIQCGRETLSRTVAAPDAPAWTETYDSWGAALVAFLILSFLAGSALLFWFFVQGRTEFSKAVGGGKAALLVRAGRKMEKVRVSDPVCFGYAGKEMRFSIPVLEAGREWRFEYEMDSPSGALPASLEADCAGKTISMLSELRVEGTSASPSGTGGGKKPAARRRLARARP